MQVTSSRNSSFPTLPSPALHGTDKKVFWGGAAVSFLFSLALYIKTMAASSSFWDSGEFIATSYALGVPHSPGTPLYVLVGRVFTELPLPFFSIAERVNLLSAFCAAVGAFLIYVLAVRFLDFTMGASKSHADVAIKAVGALVGALFIAASDTYWNNAIEAEVYAMSTALMGFMTWLALRWGERPRDVRSTFLVYLLFYLLAMSVGFHLGTILAVSGVFFYIVMTKDKPFSNLEFIVACIGVGIFVADATLYRDGRITLVLLGVYVVALVWLHGSGRKLATVTSLLFLLGLSVHLYLKIRSGHNPAIDEGDPETWRRLYAVLRREQYPQMNIFARKAGFAFQLQHFWGYFQAQFEIASAYLGKLNVGMLIPAALGIWGMVEQYTKHKKTFIMLFVTLVVTSLGLILFLNFTANEVRERDYFYSPALFYFALYIGIGAASVLNELRNLLSRSGAPAAPVVTLFAAGLLVLPVFTLAHHYYTHDRTNNYTCPVYARNMLIGLEKNAVLFTNGDNDTFPLWYIQEVEGYRKDVKVVNLSLLNTPWYIKQCRDNEPKVPIAWTDAQIDQKTPIPTKNGWVLIRDLAVNEILVTNEWRKPIYFAVTIPPETYEPYRDYLEMEGLAYLVVPKKEKNMINVAKLEQNILEKFKYTSILDKNWKRDRSVYLPPYTEHLIQNYAAAFIQLSFIQNRDSLYEKAVRNMEIAREISPQMDTPRQLLPYFYLDAGDTVNAIQFCADRITSHPDDLDIRYRLAGIYERINRPLDSLEQLDFIFARDKESRDVFMAAVGMALRVGQNGKARAYMTEWLRVHPDDATTREYLKDLDRQLQGGQPATP